MPGALDELHHADAVAAPQHAQRQSERRRRFALAGAGVDDEQSLLDRLLRDFGILHRLALRHLGAMAFGLGLCRLLPFMASPYSVPFTRERQSGDDEHDAIGARGDALVEQALQIAKPPAERMIRHDAGTDFVGDQHHRRRGRRSVLCSRSRDLRLDIGRPPASDSTATASGNRPAPASCARFERGGEIARRLDGPPVACRGARDARRCAQPFPRRRLPPSPHKSKAVAARRSGSRHSGSCPNGRRRGRE